RLGCRLEDIPLPGITTFPVASCTCPPSYLGNRRESPANDCQSAVRYRGMVDTKKPRRGTLRRGHVLPFDIPRRCPRRSGILLVLQRALRVQWCLPPGGRGQGLVHGLAAHGRLAAR